LVGLLQKPAVEWASFRPASIALDESKVASLIGARNAARRVRNFAEADCIRDELAKMGVELEDHKDGTTTWKLKRVA